MWDLDDYLWFAYVPPISAVPCVVKLFSIYELCSLLALALSFEVRVDIRWVARYRRKSVGMFDVDHSLLAYRGLLDGVAAAYGPVWQLGSWRNGGQTAIYEEFRSEQSALSSAY
jgi:hypothetical protein